MTGIRLVACPLKDGLACCAGTPDVVSDCRCGSCFRWREIYDNPRDAFLSRLTAKGVRA